VSVEIERKFVLSKPPEELDDAPSDAIEQGYLAITDDGIEVRIRRIGDRTVLTVKQGSGERRLEEEVDIPAASFEALWPLTEGRRIEKRRYRLDHDGHQVEVDVYAGALEGLVVAEIEFESEQASATFEPPDWLEREVTGEERYANQRLALEGPPAS
jgi:CYTH domain-containing protein